MYNVGFQKVTIGTLHALDAHPKGANNGEDSRARGQSRGSRAIDSPRDRYEGFSAGSAGAAQHPSTCEEAIQAVQERAS